MSNGKWRFAAGLVATVAILASGLSAAAAAPPDLKAEFLAHCDEQCKLIEKPRTMERFGRFYYWDSYAVRALCVAHDLTGKREYLDVSKRWCNQMIEYQQRMIPKGAYYMQYSRRPGLDEGDWYVADCSSIALGVLATSVRYSDPAERRRYLDSVQAFVKLVTDNYVRPSGGVTPGIYSKHNNEWWCSTGIFGSLNFCLYEETGDEAYRKIGLGAIDWLNQQDLLTIRDMPDADDLPPTVLMYCLEAYSSAYPHLEQGSKRHRDAMSQLAKAHAWMEKNLGGRAKIDYVSQWGAKFGGLPYHLYRYAPYAPKRDDVLRLADGELRYIAELLPNAPAKPRRDQLAIFLMMSYAERLSPGSLYRTSKP